MMKNIYLVRHGQSASNAGRVAIRNPQIPLTELGEQQSRAVADWLLDNVQPIDRIFVSAFIRTHQTATPLAQATGIEPTVIEGLQEFNYIAFERIDGLPVVERRQLSAHYWQTASRDFIDGGANSDAESFAQLQARMTRVIDYFNALPDGNHVVYTHGLWSSMLLWRLLGLPTQNNADMQRFRQFELAIDIKNSEVILLSFLENNLPAMTKVRTVDHD